uniref:Secreted protein n=1 Tax=Heterorhabditis bacteriophora TaxID=37862 RepID=A0A1I7WPG1_HETBA
MGIIRVAFCFTLTVFLDIFLNLILSLFVIPMDYGHQHLDVPFHYTQCINHRGNALYFGKVRKEAAAVGTFFRRLQMLPFMLPHLVALSSALKPPSTPVVDF